MNSQGIQALVDKLLARDHSYRPIELLSLTRRLDKAGLAATRSGEIRVLEDVLYGNVSRCEAAAEDRGRLGRHLNLELRDRAPVSAGSRRCFASLRRSAGTHALASPRSVTAGGSVLDNRFCRRTGATGSSPVER